VVWYFVMTERETTPGILEFDYAALRVSARELFDLASLTEAGDRLASIPPELEDVNPAGAAITRLAAGILDDPDARNRFNEWARPLRELASRRLHTMPSDQLRDYAVTVHLRGAVEHPHLAQAEQVIEMMTEEQYDRDFGWPFLILYECLEK
jgi:hypothetical protein